VTATATTEQGVREPGPVRLLWLVLGAAAGLYLLAFVVIALLRLAYPFELEWMEGGAVLHVQRILDGKPLHAPPQLEFTAYLYAPLYFYVSALVAALTGNGFLPLRLVSFGAALGCCVLIFLLVRRRTASRSAAVIAACLFAATFRAAGAWLDLARVDSLFLFLVLAGLHAFDARSALARSLLAPLLIALATFTKQPALLVALALSLVAVLTRKGRERVAFPLVFGGLFAGVGWWANAATAGWYSYYVFELPMQHEIEAPQVLGFWTVDILQTLGIALGFAVVGGWSTRGTPTSGPAAGRRFADACILGVLFAVSYASRIHSGGYDNVLMPVYAGIAIYFGIGLGALCELRARRPRLVAGLLTAAIAQFGLLWYWPPAQLPSDADRAQGEQILRRIAGIDGEVYWAEHPWYAGLVGKPTQAQDVALLDVVRASASGEWRQRLEQEMADAVRSGRYAAFVVDFPVFTLRPPDFEAHYELVDSSLSGDAFRMMTGYDRRPSLLYVRRR
jgi:Dolichyl-phosphate-mannose-protein mannosyltransferase